MMPTWTYEPDVSVIANLAWKHLHCDIEATGDVEYLAQGAFNKLYKVFTGSDTVLMRVILPVDPHNKTMSEVSTIELVRKNTDIPVPKIFAFDANNQNELGFERILMEMMPGKPMSSRWRKLSWAAKDTLVKRIAHFQAQTYHLEFSGIGNLYQLKEDERIVVDHKALSHENGAKFMLGRIVSISFFLGRRLYEDVARSPFNNSADWLNACLNLLLLEQNRLIDDCDDEDVKQEAQDTAQSAEKMLKLLPRIFWSEQEDTRPESSRLCHDDLSQQNILID